MLSDPQVPRGRPGGDSSALTVSATALLWDATKTDTCSSSFRYAFHLNGAFLSQTSPLGYCGRVRGNPKSVPQLGAGANAAQVCLQGYF